MSTDSSPAEDTVANGISPERRSAQSATALILLLDGAAVAGAFLAALYLRASTDLLGPFTHTFSQYYALWPVVLLWPVLLWREGLYRGLWLPGSEHLKRLVQASTVASMLLMAATFVTQTGPGYSRAVLLGGWLLSIPVLALERFALKATLSKLGFAGPRAVLLGSLEAARVVLESIAKQRPASLRPVAIFNDEPAEQGDRVHGVPVRGGIDDAEGWARRHDVTTAIVALPRTQREDLLALLEGPDSAFRRTIVVPDLIGLSTAETTAHDLGGVLALEVKKNLTYPHNRVIKRTLDWLLILVLTPVALPLAVIITLAIAIESGRPILFGQARVGLRGQKFTAWKFRTMVVDAPSALERHLQADAEARREWRERQKLTDDPRLTTVGRVLRRFSMDELPQLWNVLRSEMSLVGPRPIMTDQMALYGAPLNLYQQVRPGLTGLWQVSGRASTTFEERVELDQYYVRNWSVWLDLVIIARTFWAVMSGRGAY